MMSLKAKLVRDKIPEIIRKDGREPVVTILGGEKLTQALNAKFLEEYDEYLSASNDAERLVELADVLEVVISTAKHLGMSEEELLKLCHKKREDRGAFLKGYLYEGDAKK